MSKEYVVKISKELHATLADASKATGLSMHELADKILRGQGITKLPDKGNLAEGVATQELDKALKAMDKALKDYQTTWKGLPARFHGILVEKGYLK